MSDFPEFTVRVDQNPYLPAGGREMHAIVSVEARSSGAAPAAAGRAPAAEIIMIDTSGSMSYRGKMAAAKRAARAAVNVLRDGVHFAVVAGANRPRMIYPQGERLVVADETSRRNAATAIGRLEAAGGTAIGSWLRLAERLFAGHDAAVGESAVKHAILLTDGKNQHESDEELDAALRQCTGRFLCDARGVGTDWDVAELRKISSALLGGFLDVPDPADLEADFLAMTRAAMSKEIADVTLRVWTPQQAKLRFVKQMVPVVEDLTGRRVESGTQTGDYPLGAWGNENREYHVCVEVQPGDIGRQMRAGWVKLVAGDEVLASGNVLAEWTDDEARSTRINGRVAIHTGQSELADAIQEGLEARREGDEDTATARLGRAVVLAREVGNEQISDLLDKVVDVVDPVRGTVRLKRDVAKADEMSLDTRSVRTVRTRHGDEAGG
ncbi:MULTISPECIES: VWA domain-containing protein [Actinomadura]|uniref:von Willebrand factor type A domain-containing protein n=1 Tax=Actinomadura madurae TaxID=1993 RepID=A0A1I5M1I9_9ACTN|nr:VWA domain-containing protein [Actinomadura madurae]SFP02856.1 von Willebrand factor type A domain-containing protein [Actinomadura madurae]SPT52273.1 Mg-chelatase subunit ChlD [Actinomadura madurae]